jgi:EAL domain-containing protein (putative c-di-GMP-specific phosphodiesterase class I)
MLFGLSRIMSWTIAIPAKADAGNELLLKAALVVFCATFAGGVVVSAGWGARYLALPEIPANAIMALSSIVAALVALRSGARLMRLGAERAPDGPTGGKASAELRAAIRRGQIVPYYQPIVRLKTGELTGFECFPRWLHPTRGVVMPRDFMPLAERAGLISGLSQSLLAQVCADAKAWPSALTVSIKLHPSQLLDEALARMILTILAEGRLGPERLIVEVTAANLLDEVGDALTVIFMLRKAGVRLAMDDFGIGCAGLRELPFDRIKLNESFVEQLDRPDQAGFVGEVLALGRALNLPITAEGVESAATAEMLARCGCDAAQGGLFGEAISYYRARNLADVLTRARVPDAMRLAGDR